MEFMKICGSGERRKKNPGQEKGGKPLRKLLEMNQKRKLRLVMKVQDPEKNLKVSTFWHFLTIFDYLYEVESEADEGSGSSEGKVTEE